MAVSINPAVSARRVRVIIDGVEYNGDLIEMRTYPRSDGLRLDMEIANVQINKTAKPVPVAETPPPSRRIIQEEVV